MRVLVAGATGAVGRRLVPALLAAGHEVVAMCRSNESAGQARAAGAEAVIADALDAGAVAPAVAEARPDAVVNQLTALPKRIDPRHIERDFELNDRLRSEGSRILADAAREAGARRLVAQSIAFMYEPGPAGTIHGEDDPLLRDPPPAFARTANAVKTLERTVLDAGGTVLRYGYFYGPGSAVAADGSTVSDLRRRRFPIVGSGAGVWSFVHVDDAAAAAVAALRPEAPTGVFNVVDDEPAPVSQWLPELAAAAGAPRPMRVPAFLARLAAGDYGVATMTAAQGASNERARRELGWEPAHPSWREGFRAALG
jgi:nucleoside-diphosphate-sugar epimerase